MQSIATIEKYNKTYNWSCAVCLLLRQLVQFWMGSVPFSTGLHGLVLWLKLLLFPALSTHIIRQVSLYCVFVPLIVMFIYNDKCYKCMKFLNI